MKIFLRSSVDLTYSVDLTTLTYANKQSLTVNGKNKDITLKSLEIVGLANDIQDYSILIDWVATAPSQFETHAREFKLDKNLINSIQTDIIFT